MRIVVDVPDYLRASAIHGLTALIERIGIPSVLGSGAQISRPDLIYSLNSHKGSNAGLWIPCDPSMYEPTTECVSSVVDGLTVWRPRGGLDSGIDPIGAIFRLLSLLDESQVSQLARDSLGTFVNEALPRARRRTTAEPLVENCVDLVWRRLCRVRPKIADARLPRWPENAPFAVAVTHDVDAVHLGALKEIAYTAARAMFRLDPRSAAMAVNGLRWLGRADTNPLNAFDIWRQLEFNLGIRSAFYLFLRPKRCRPTRRDCRSSVDSVKLELSPIRRMAEAGWEFGFHPAIRARESVAELTRGRQWIDRNVGVRPSGVRHHYLGIDWRRPVETFRQYLDAGFIYDSSIAWRNSVGFRAGTCLPYRPYDFETGAEIALLELPLSIMNNHIAGPGVHIGRRTSPIGRLDDGLALVERVRRCGGLLVINWHQEVAVDRWVHAGFMEGFSSIWTHVNSGVKPWVATPAEIAEHWARYSQGLMQCIPCGERKS